MRGKTQKEENVMKEILEIEQQLLEEIEKLKSKSDT